MDSWVVVEFMPANEGDIPDCKAVPTTWLSESKGTLMCCYPSGMSDRQIIFIIASHALPDPSWSKFRVRKFPNSVCDSYEKARELELVAIDTSDVDADKVLGRGQRRKRVKYESDDESDYCPRRKMPSPPKMVKEPTASHKSVLVSHNVRSTEAAAIFMESAGPSTSCISAINADTSTSSDTFSSGGACNCGCKENKRLILPEVPARLATIEDKELDYPVSAVCTSSQSAPWSRMSSPNSLEWDPCEEDGGVVGDSSVIYGEDAETEQLISEIEQLTSRALRETGSGWNGCLR